MRSVVADTHALIWYLTAPELLSPTSRGVLEDVVAAGGAIAVSAVSLIELVYVAEKRSDSIDAETLGLVLDVVEEPSSPISLLPLSMEVVRAMVEIPRVHVRDPFDRAIVATARTAGLRLVTRDGLLTRFFPELCLW
ncbi:type II toxin-antitoxin system VapC family toxin [Pseudonocardia nantongensis]|uniref:type II toxin-antitoxin system VapC family toxin n=1 Tax=Pseudonocardia nantongensis TaxID=1181885 RepID=UPI00397E4D8A